MADTDWISELAQKRRDAQNAAVEKRERALRAIEEREALITPFWDALVDACDRVVREVNTKVAPLARLTRRTGPMVEISYETHRLGFCVMRDSMTLQVTGLDRALPPGTSGRLVVADGRILGPNKQTPQELAGELMRAFFQMAV